MLPMLLCMNENAHFSLSDPDFITDPYATYDMMRKQGPLYSVAPGVWLVTHYEVAAKALLDKRLSNRPAPFALVHKRHRDTFVAADVASHLIAFRDPPESIPARRLLATELLAFCRGRGPGIATLATELVQGLQADMPFDFVDVIAVPFAVRAMCRIFGFPETDADRLKEWSAQFFHMFHSIPDRDTLLRMNVSLGAFRAYVHASVTEHRSTPGDDLLHVLAQANPEVIDDAALVDNVMLMVADMIENVWAGIASALKLLLENRSVVDAFLADGGTWEQLVDECLRLESPGQYQGRIATEPMDIGGTSLNAYALVLVGFAAANRDGSVFPNPDVFQPGRKGPRHLAFGLGPHACIGATLVRMEMVAILSAIWPLAPEFDMAGSELRWEARAGHRWLSTLLVRLSSSGVS